jgi:hypothetical protein
MFDTVVLLAEVELLRKPIFILRLLPRAGEKRWILASRNFEWLQLMAQRKMDVDQASAEMDYKDNHEADPDFWNTPPNPRCYKILEWRQCTDPEKLNYMRSHTPVIANRWYAWRDCDNDDECRGFCNAYDIIELAIEP